MRDGLTCNRPGFPHSLFAFLFAFLFALLSFSSLMSLQAQATVYSDSESGSNDGWRIFDARPIGATVSVVADSTLNSQVTVTSGDGRSNSYLLGGVNPAEGWNNSDEFLFDWKMWTAEPFAVHVYVETATGPRRLSYNQSNANSLKNPSNDTIHFGLGSNAVDSAWHSYQRDLEADVAQGEPGNALLSVNGILVLGSVRLDDIALTDGTSGPPADPPVDEPPVDEPGEPDEPPADPSPADPIPADTPPTAAITTSSTSGNAPVTIEFSAANSSAVAPATIASYVWDFGNGLAASVGGGFNHVRRAGPLRCHAHSHRQRWSDAHQLYRNHSRRNFRSRS